MAVYSTKQQVRTCVAEMARQRGGSELCADAEAMAAAPEQYYDRVIEDWSFHSNLTLTVRLIPDAASCLSLNFAAKVKANDYPRKMEAGLIGSCTNLRIRI